MTMQEEWKEVISHASKCYERVIIELLDIPKKPIIPICSICAVKDPDYTHHIHVWAHPFKWLKLRFKVARIEKIEEMSAWGQQCRKFQRPDSDEFRWVLTFILNGEEVQHFYSEISAFSQMKDYNTSFLCGASAILNNISIEYFKIHFDPALPFNIGRKRVKPEIEEDEL